MSIASYSELQTAVANWLDRTDLTDRIPEFIALAESDIARNLRKVTVRAALDLDSAEVDLPAECGELRSVRLNTTPNLFALTIVTPEALADYRSSSSGRPRYASVVDGVLLLDVAPDATYTAEIIYFEKLVPLSEDASSNSTLTDSPDIYLFATLKEAELFLEHDDRNPVWAQKYRQALQDENNARERAELGAAPTAMRLPVVF